jgi:peptidoglycan/LPS O-acetylase OafA/YrhL
MDPAYGNWLWLLLGGVILGVFVRPRTVGILTGVCFLLAVLGLVVSAAFSLGNYTMLFGIAATAVPIIGAVGTVGAVLGASLRKAIARLRQ